MSSICYSFESQAIIRIRRYGGLKGIIQRLAEALQRKKGVDELSSRQPPVKRDYNLHAYGFPNFAALIATLVFTPVIFAVHLPSSQRKVSSKGN